MRYSIALLLGMVLVVTCSMPSVARSQTQAAGPESGVLSERHEPELDANVEFLIHAAANDFHAQSQPRPTRFRHVRVGHSIGTDKTTKQYMLCGEFLPSPKESKARWTPFATIKTSGYEQLLGAQAASFCRNPKILWDKEDFSSTLQSRFDSMR